VAYLGNYDPHTKTATLDSEKASQYLNNGAQPSERVATLLQKEGVKLPAWVETKRPKERTVRNPEKRRSTAPAQPAPEAPVEEPAAEETNATETAATLEAEPTQPAAAAQAPDDASPAEEPATSDEA
jgi:small subunit ribosomal protein S16